MILPEPNSGCWFFTGYVDRLGYGIIADGKHTRLKAHRAAYMVFRGPIPKMMDVLHTCDIRCCVNPDHLWLGTHLENMHDMIKKGRSNFGGYGPAKSMSDYNQLGGTPHAPSCTAFAGTITSTKAT
jgi:hypothetical protein